MKKIFLVAAIAIGTAFSAQAADGTPFKLLLGIGLTGGGDTLITVPFTDGSRDDIKAGELVQLYGGGEFRLADRLALQATVGYHVNDTRAASNGSPACATWLRKYSPKRGWPRPRRNWTFAVSARVA